ncbi:hypothetical protein PAUR_a3615 [Pseudoalteromonas aurantia 208]|uniref:Uncharacterized protein n=1 Tax=Pseudoalteromonas aurantia 208 TaxID=1314867 RepID=A0ABR9E6G6_9GAMM|nr:hypothetical protein [Pseudoalteromonas aurantia 208]
MYQLSLSHNPSYKTHLATHKKTQQKPRLFALFLDVYYTLYFATA